VQNAWLTVRIRNMAYDARRSSQVTRPASKFNQVAPEYQLVTIVATGHG